MNNTKKVTIKMVADRVGMSIAAVSRAFDNNSKLKDEKREYILKTAKEMGYTPNKMAARLSLKPIRIGVVIYGRILPYYSEYIRGIRYAHQKFVDYKVELELIVVKGDEEPIEKAYSAIDKLVEEKYDGVVLSGLDEESDLPYVNKLAENSIPFVILDTDIKDCKRNGVSMKNSEIAGKMAAQLLGISMDNKNRNVAVLCYKLSQMSQRNLVDSFCEAAKRYALNVAEIIETNNDLGVTYEETKRLLAKGDIDGVYVSSAISSPVCKAISESDLSKKVGLVISDLYPEIYPYIEDGTIFATIVQNPFLQAKRAFESLFYHLTENEKIEEFMYIKPIAVFESNLSLYINE